MDRKIKLTIKQQDAPIRLSVQASQGGSGEIYTGAYEVTPNTSEQVLDTKDKVMVKDVTVHEIPYAETSNLYGTTAIIAS